MLEERPRSTRRALADRWLVPAGWATLVGNVVLVLTGGTVRLTGSGLGCPNWPRCTDRSFTPHGALDVHSAIEFGNRALTFVLVAVAVATLVAAFASSRRDLRRPAVLLALGIPLQAVVGGVSVLTDLNPWVVSLHLLLSLAIIGYAVRYLWRLRYPTPEPTEHQAAARLAWAVFAVGWVVLYLGTVVTGSGPHAGDADSPRNGLDPVQTSQLHADLVFLFVGLTVGLLVVLNLTRATAGTLRAAWTLLGIELAQGAIGFVQYFTGLPIVVVALHLVGAALISATMTWVLLASRTAQVALSATNPD